MRKLYKDQLELDTEIRKSKKIVIEELELLSKVCCAANCEVVEFYEEKDEEKALFEYVDILHFLLRINNILNLDYMVIYKFEDIYNACKFELDATRNDEILDFYIAFNKFIDSTRCFKYWSIKPSEDINRLKDNFAVTMFNFFSLGNFMGYKAKQVLEAYEIKRQENFNRQKVGY